jgi:hypothetical protein
VCKSHNVICHPDRKMLVPFHDAAHAMRRYMIKDDRTLPESGRILGAQNLYLGPGPIFTGFSWFPQTLSIPAQYLTLSHNRLLPVLYDPLFTNHPLTERYVV